MGERGPSRRVHLDDVLRVFDQRADPAEPLTASEVAESLGCSHRTALDRLHELAGCGDVTSKKVGGRSRVWWLSVRADGDTGIASDDPLFSAPSFAVDEPEIEIDDVLSGEVSGP